MNLLINRLQEYSRKIPHKTAIQGDAYKVNYSQLNAEILAFIPQLKGHRIGLIVENHPAWAIIDLSIMYSHKCCIPIPTFFSDSQIKHTINDAKIDLLIFDNDELPAKLGLSSKQVIRKQVLDKEIRMINLETSDKKEFSGKITYTSGTTGSPKGVMLSEQSIMQKTQYLAEAIQADSKDKGLSLLPLSTLLENIGGLYVPLLVGATATILTAAKTGITGSSQFNPQALINTLLEVQPTAFIVIPQLLGFLVKVSQDGIQLPNSIRYIAVGGAHVSRHLLEAAKQHNLPVFQGYGLSEAASVVSLNTPKKNKIGSVGQSIKPHQIKIAEDGEILIKGQLFSGYLGQSSHAAQEYHASGDLGKIDADGFLHILGRKKNLIVNSYGRNLSPEWLENEIESLAPISQAVVFGEARPFLIAVIVPSSAAVKYNEINQAILKLNIGLPDYAQIQHFIFATQPFSVANGLLNQAGYPNRNQIYQNYFSAINLIYEKTA